MIQPMNPWASIWLKPRQTIRQIVDTDPRRFVMLLAMSAGAAGMLMQAEQLGRFGLPLNVVIPIALGAGALWGLTWLYLFGWLYRWVGNWFGGQAKHVEVRAAIAWVEVPTFAVFLVWLVIWVVSHSPALTSGKGQVGVSMTAAVLPGIFALASTIAGIWRTVLACHTLGEVHRFSAWKGLGTLAIPNTLLVVPVFFIAMMAAIAIPNVLRGRIAANESAAIGNLRALVSSLEMFRSVHDTYPASAEWGRAMVRQAEVPFAPPSFQTDHALSDFEVQGYLFTYTSEELKQYAISAVPREVDSTGRRSFYADDTGLVRHCVATTQRDRATLHDPAIDGEERPCARSDSLSR